MVDATLGGGGHARAFADILGAEGRLLGLDRDPEALAEAAQALAQAPCQVQLKQANFAELAQIFEDQGWSACDILLADLGVSSHQLDDADRGFSFMHDGPLDMRMDPTQGQSAAELLHSLDVDSLVRILRMYGEEPAARRIATAIKAVAPLQRTGELAALIEKIIPRRPGQKIHPATRSFQALRIAVNGELDAVQDLLSVLPDLLSVGGRAGIISFHSLEDRLVKRAFADWSQSCRCPSEWPQCRCGGEAKFRVPKRAGFVAADDEREHNPRARSARLRVIERVVAGPLFNPAKLGSAAV